MAGNLEPTNNSSGMSRLQFPSHYDAEQGHWMSFTRMKYKRATATDPDDLVRADGAETINLPIPAQLAQAYAAQWDNIELGVMGNQWQETAGTFFDTATTSFQRSGGIMGSIYEGFKSVGTVQNGKNYLQAAGTSLATDNSLFKFAGKATGLARNPFKAVAFNSVGFRSFNFSFVLVPNSYEEAKTIRSIGKQFKVGMAPGIAPIVQNGLYTYPDVFIIEFEKPEFLFKIAPCVLRSCNINYHNEGSALYFSHEEEKIPASISIDLDFQEIAILTKDDFETKGY